MRVTRACTASIAVARSRDPASRSGTPDAASASARRVAASTASAIAAARRPSAVSSRRAAISAVIASLSRASHAALAAASVTSGTSAGGQRNRPGGVGERGGTLGRQRLERLLAGRRLALERRDARGALGGPFEQQARLGQLGQQGLAQRLVEGGIALDRLGQTGDRGAVGLPGRGALDGRGFVPHGHGLVAGCPRLGRRGRGGEQGSAPSPRLSSRSSPRRPRTRRARRRAICPGRVRPIGNGVGESP